MDNFQKDVGDMCFLNYASTHINRTCNITLYLSLDSLPLGYNVTASRGTLGKMSARVPPKLSEDRRSEDSFGGTRADIFPSMPRLVWHYNIITQNSDFYYHYP